MLTSIQLLKRSLFLNFSTTNFDKAETSIETLKYTVIIEAFATLAFVISFIAVLNLWKKTAVFGIFIASLALLVSWQFLTALSSILIYVPIYVLIWHDRMKRYCYKSTQSLIVIDLYCWATLIIGAIMLVSIKAMAILNILIN